LLLSSLVAVVACEHGVNIQGSVEVAPEIQALYSPQTPGVVEISTDIPKTGRLAARLAVLCDPSAAPLVIPYELDDFGCEQEATITAWVTLLQDPVFECGVAQDFSTGDLPDRVDASASTIIFRGKSGRCRNGEATAELVLAE